MSEDRGERKPRPHGGARRRPRRKVCDFCVSKIEYIDYKSDKHLDYAADKIDRVLKQYVPEEMFVPFDERHKVNFL